MRRAGGGGGETDESTHLAGVLSCVFGNILISLALNLQRRAHRDNVAQVPYTKLKGWWMGLLCMFVGEIGNFLVGFSVVPTCFCPMYLLLLHARGRAWSVLADAVVTGLRDGTRGSRGAARGDHRDRKRRVFPSLAAGAHAPAKGDGGGVGSDRSRHDCCGRALGTAARCRRQGAFAGGRVLRPHW